MYLLFILLFIYTYLTIHLYSLIIYVFNIHSIIHLYVFTIHSTIHLYVFYYLLTYSLLNIHYTLYIIHYILCTIQYALFTIYYLLFNIYYLSFTIYYSIFTIYYLGKNPYLMEFDKTPIFWYPCVARDALINLTFCSDQF